MRKRAPLPLGDGSDRDAAQMMCLPIEEFARLQPQLVRRGFPLPDPDTRRYDLDAIAAWRRRRHPHLFTDDKEGGLTLPGPARDAAGVVGERLGAMGRGKRGDPLLRR